MGKLEFVDELLCESQVQLGFGKALFGHTVHGVNQLVRNV